MGEFAQSCIRYIHIRYNIYDIQDYYDYFIQLDEDIITVARVIIGDHVYLKWKRRGKKGYRIIMMRIIVIIVLRLINEERRISKIDEE